MAENISNIINGKIFIVNLNSEISSENVKNKIVIAKTLNVRILPLLTSCKCIILENGGYLSHFAIFCREIGIPFKIIGNITKQVKDGQIVEIDFDSGKII